MLAVIALIVYMINMFFFKVHIVVFLPSLIHGVAFLAGTVGVICFAAAFSAVTPTVAIAQLILVIL